MRSYHIILADGTERDVVGRGVEVKDGVLTIEGADGEEAVIYAQGTWTLVETQHKDD